VRPPRGNPSKWQIPDGVAQARLKARGVEVLEFDNPTLDEVRHSCGDHARAYPSLLQLPHRWSSTATAEATCSASGSVAGT
jgi:hypothetical protein